MRPEEDDEPGIGPPPDPSVRAWRHPSEIAAAARCSQPPARREARIPTVVALTAAMAVVVVFGTAALSNLDLGGGSGIDAGSGFEALTADATAGRSGSAALLPPGSDRQRAAKGDPAAVKGDPAAAGAAPGATWSTSTTLPPPGATTLVPTSLTTTTAVISTVTSIPTTSSYPTGTAWPTAQGVHPAGSAVRLASFTVIDNLVVTSASAVTGHSDLELRVGDVTAPATVGAIDPFTDLAVLAIDSQSLEAVLAALGTAGPITVAAEVIGADQRAVLANGQHVYGSLLTATPRPAGAAGAPLVDDGQVVGVILDADQTLISALPIDEVVEVVGTLATWDVGSLAWVGLAGVTAPDGGAEVANVTSGAPADRAGIRPADRITTIDGVTVRDWSHVIHLTRSAGPGRSLEVKVDRHGRVITVDLTIGSRLGS